MIKAVVFDLGEVLSSPPSLLPQLAQHLGVTAKPLEEHYWTGRDAHDAGAPVDQYWGPLVAAAGVTGDPDLFADIALLDASIWAELRPAARQLLRDCRAAGVTVAILSNAPHALHTEVGKAPWRSDIDHLFVSAAMGMMKPDAAIYTAVADEMGLAGSQIAFVDDKHANVDGAQAVGWHAHLWVDDEDTRQWLVGLGVL